LARKLLPMIEEKLAPLNARPHWAKVFTMPPARLAEVYGNLPRFRELLTHSDPQGKFRNQFIDTNIFRP
jgi:alditol oxidase